MGNAQRPCFKYPRSPPCDPKPPGLRGFHGPGTRISSCVSTAVTGASKLSRTDPPHGIRVAAEWKGRARGRPEREPQHNSRQPCDAFSAPRRLRAAGRDASPAAGTTGTGSTCSLSRRLTGLVVRLRPTAEAHGNCSMPRPARAPLRGALRVLRSSFRFRRAALAHSLCAAATPLWAAGRP